MRPSLSRPFASGLLALVILLAGCANPSRVRREKLDQALASGNLPAAIAATQKSAKKLYGDRNRFLYFMDLGLLFHYAEKYDSSVVYLNRAVDVLEELYAVSVSNQALSLVTNDNLVPYRGRPYEIVLCHQYLAFGYLALGKVDAALVEARRTQLRFEEWQRRNKGEKFTEDGMFHYFASIAYEAARERDNALISLYKSVSAYQGGVVPLPAQVGEKAYRDFSAQDRADDIRRLKLAAPAGPAPKAGNAEIILVGSAGRGPVLEENKFWGTYVRDGALIIHYQGANGDTLTEALPAPGLPASETQKYREGRRTRSGTTFSVTFALPEVKARPSNTQFFEVEGGGERAVTAPLTQLDRLAEQNLKDDRVAVLTRTVVRVVLRTMALQKTKSELAGSNPLANLLMSLGLDFFQGALEKADTRHSLLLPKTVQVARLAVAPGTHALRVAAKDAQGRTLENRDLEVTVKPGEKKFVFVSSLR